MARSPLVLPDVRAAQWQLARRRRQVFQTHVPASKSGTTATVTEATTSSMLDRMDMTSTSARLIDVRERAAMQSAGFTGRCWTEDELLQMDPHPHVLLIQQPGSLARGVGCGMFGNQTKNSSECCQGSRTNMNNHVKNHVLLLLHDRLGFDCPGRMGNGLLVGAAIRWRSCHR
jgi:hypothetical protein